MSQKIDFIEFQRKFQEQYGLPDHDMDRVQRVHLLTFFTSDDGRVMSRLPSGGIVFRHKEGGMHINPGETWVCELLERSTTFFAIGMLKLDTKSLFDLRSDQMDQLAEIVWEKNRTILEPRFEERYLNQVKETMDKQLQESRKREDDALKNCEELKIASEASNMKMKMVIASLQKELEEAKRSTSLPTKDEGGVSNLVVDHSPIVPVHPKIRRLAPDVISSEHFVHRNYFVHMSADQSVMTIRPHDQGNVICFDKRITLVGLGMVSPYDGPTDLPSEYNPKYGGYMVLLKYLPPS